MHAVYYLGYYDTPANQEENRYYELAAANKMTYIVSAIEAGGQAVEVVSPCVTKRSQYFPGKVVPLGKHSRLRLFTTFPQKPRIIRVLGRYLTSTQAFLYLLFKLKKGDTLIAYHSLALMRMIRWLKRLRSFRLILEAEEIYGDVVEKQEISQKELNFFQIAEGYMLPARLLNEKINKNNKPCVLIHGTYQAEEDRHCSFADGKIHCVYAGTLEPHKGGGTMAANAARHLPENYHLHILGFGTPAEVEAMQKLTGELSQVCRCKITYDGCLKGEDYIRFLQSCQIGLSTQNPNAAYNDTSFPSKILSYMANGLKVVTVRIPVVEDSAVGQSLFYYDTPTPEAIAEAIVAAASSDDADRRLELMQLDRRFQKEIKALLEDV